MNQPDYKYTLEEYWKLVEAFPEHKYEYVDGRIHMLPGGSPAYAQLGARMVTLLSNALHDSKCNIYSAARVQLTEQRCYIPTVTVSCDPRDWTRKDALWSPNVVVEVISLYTEKTDKSEKLAWYQRYPTILEILFVDSRKRYVEHYHRLDERTWQETLYEHEGDVIDLASIEVSLMLREIYFKVYLEVAAYTGR